MLGIPSTLAQGTLQAQDTPLQDWVTGWLGYLSDNLPLVFLVVAILIGMVLLMKGDGIKQAVLFAIGAALAFLLLTNLESVAAFLGEELPLQLDRDLPSTESPPPQDPGQDPD